MKDITGEGMFPLQWDRGQGRASAGSDGGGGTQGWSPGNWDMENHRLVFQDSEQEKVTDLERRTRYRGNSDFRRPPRTLTLFQPLLIKISTMLYL